jgi:hypothetical protein
MADYETKIKDFNETVKRRLHLDFFEPSGQPESTFSNSSTGNLKLEVQ